jgi:hypothetical protein
VDLGLKIELLLLPAAVEVLAKLVLKNYFPKAHVLCSSTRIKISTLLPSGNALAARPFKFALSHSNTPARSARW